MNEALLAYDGRSVLNLFLQKAMVHSFSPETLKNMKLNGVNLVIISQLPAWFRVQSYTFEYFLFFRYPDECYLNSDL